LVSGFERIGLLAVAAPGVGRSVGRPPASRPPACGIHIDSIERRRKTLCPD
jgi:hypothetical protein